MIQHSEEENKKILQIIMAVRLENISIVFKIIFVLNQILKYRLIIFLIKNGDNKLFENLYYEVP